MTVIKTDDIFLVDSSNADSPDSPVQDKISEVFETQSAFFTDDNRERSTTFKSDTPSSPTLTRSATSTTKTSGTIRTSMIFTDISGTNSVGLNDFRFSSGSDDSDLLPLPRSTRAVSVMGEEKVLGEEDSPVSTNEGEDSTPTNEDSNTTPVAKKKSGSNYSSNPAIPILDKSIILADLAKQKTDNSPLVRKVHSPLLNSPLGTTKRLSISSPSISPFKRPVSPRSVSPLKRPVSPLLRKAISYGDSIAGGDALLPEVVNSGDILQLPKRIPFKDSEGILNMHNIVNGSNGNSSGGSDAGSVHGNASTDDDFWGNLTPEEYSDFDILSDFEDELYDDDDFSLEEAGLDERHQQLLLASIELARDFKAKKRQKMLKAGQRACDNANLEAAASNTIGSNTDNGNNNVNCLATPPVRRSPFDKIVAQSPDENSNVFLNRVDNNPFFSYGHHLNMQSNNNNVLAQRQQQQNTTPSRAAQKYFLNATNPLTASKRTKRKLALLHTNYFQHRQFPRPLSTIIEADSNQPSRRATVNSNKSSSQYTDGTSVYPMDSPKLSANRISFERDLEPSAYYHEENVEFSNDFSRTPSGELIRQENSCEYYVFSGSEDEGLLENFNKEVTIGMDDGNSDNENEANNEETRADSAVLSGGVNYQVLGNEGKLFWSHLNNGNASFVPRSKTACIVYLFLIAIVVMGVYGFAELSDWCMRNSIESEKPNKLRNVLDLTEESERSKNDGNIFHNNLRAAFGGMRRTGGKNVEDENRASGCCWCCRDRDANGNYTVEAKNAIACWTLSSILTIVATSGLGLGLGLGIPACIEDENPQQQQENSHQEEVDTIGDDWVHIDTVPSQVDNDANSTDGHIPTTNTATTPQQDSDSHIKQNIIEQLQERKMSPHIIEQIQKEFSSREQVQKEFRSRLTLNLQPHLTINTNVGEKNAPVTPQPNSNGEPRTHHVVIATSSDIANDPNARSISPVSPENLEFTRGSMLSSPQSGKSTVSRGNTNSLTPAGRKRRLGDSRDNLAALANQFKTDSVMESEEFARMNGWVASDEMDSPGLLSDGQFLYNTPRRNTDTPSKSPLPRNMRSPANDLLRRQAMFSRVRERAESQSAEELLASAGGNSTTEHNLSQYGETRARMVCGTPYDSGLNTLAEDGSPLNTRAEAAVVAESSEIGPSPLGSPPPTLNLEESGKFSQDNPPPPALNQQRSPDLLARARKPVVVDRSTHGVDVQEILADDKSGKTETMTAIEQATRTRAAKERVLAELRRRSASAPTEEERKRTIQQKVASANRRWETVFGKPTASDIGTEPETEPRRERRCQFMLDVEDASRKHTVRVRPGCEDEEIYSPNKRSTKSILKAFIQPIATRTHTPRPGQNPLLTSFKKVQGTVAESAVSADATVDAAIEGARRTLEHSLPKIADEGDEKEVARLHEFANSEKATCTNTAGDQKSQQSSIVIPSSGAMAKVVSNRGLSSSIDTDDSKQSVAKSRESRAPPQFAPPVPRRKQLRLNFLNNKSGKTFLESNQRKIMEKAIVALRGKNESKTDSTKAGEESAASESEKSIDHEMPQIGDFPETTARFDTLDPEAEEESEEIGTEIRPLFEAEDCTSTTCRVSVLEQFARKEKREHVRKRLETLCPAKKSLGNVSHECDKVVALQGEASVPTHSIPASPPQPPVTETAQGVSDDCDYGADLVELSPVPPTFDANPSGKPIIYDVTYSPDYRPRRLESDASTGQANLRERALSGEFQNFREMVTPVENEWCRGASFDSNGSPQRGGFGLFAGNQRALQRDRAYRPVSGDFDVTDAANMDFLAGGSEDEDGGAIVGARQSGTTTPGIQ